MKSASEKRVVAGYKCGYSFGRQSWVMIENFSAWHNRSIKTQANFEFGQTTLPLSVQPEKLRLFARKTGTRLIVDR